MQNWGYACIGEMLIGIGQALKEPDSSLRKKFHLSREQLMTLIGVIRLVSSPDVQKLYLPDLAHRWRVSERTIKNWIARGLVREGYKTAHDTRLWWLAEELDIDERQLRKLGYIKVKKHHRVNYFTDMINGFLAGEK